MAKAAQVEHSDAAFAPAPAAGGTAGTGTAAAAGGGGGAGVETLVGWPPELGGMLAVVDSGSAVPAVTHCGAAEIIHTI